MRIGRLARLNSSDPQHRRALKLIMLELLQGYICLRSRSACLLRRRHKAKNPPFSTTFLAKITVALRDDAEANEQKILAE
jgi:hypothetical protein